MSERITIDSHQHFWKIARGDYAWMGPAVTPLLRDFLPEDLRPLLARAGIDRTVLVQAAETEAETLFMLGLAEATDFVAGVVGWLDMDDPAFPQNFDRLRQNPFLVGLRPMLQDLTDDAWILRPRVRDHLALVEAAGLAFDILSFPRHLPHVIEALAERPGLRAVVDHISKPAIAEGILDPWRADMTALAAFPNVSCKVSGMVTEAGAGWTLADLSPYVDHVAAVFGADRLMFGSDWPVSTLAADYGEVAHAARALLGRHFGPAQMDAIFGGNAARFYCLADSPAGALPAGMARRPFP